jgi:hypothetical protein
MKRARAVKNLPISSENNWPPLAAGHDAIGKRCPICDHKFVAGDRCTPIELALEQQPDEQQDTGGYIDIVLTHTNCAEQAVTAILERLGNLEPFKQ